MEIVAKSDLVEDCNIEHTLFTSYLLDTFPRILIEVMNAKLTRGRFYISISFYSAWWDDIYEEIFI